jgi:PTH1 family peptidyl-tRNA hydrolase
VLRRRRAASTAGVGGGARRSADQGRRRRKTSTARTGTPADLLVVGLGNPGEEYARTKHNVGAEVVELLADRHSGKLRKGKERALVDEVHLDGRRVALAIPLTFMNDSGESVRLLVRRYGVTPEQLVVVHDELDLPVATLRVKSGGGLAGHNGLRSIKSHLHSDEFQRVRIGVGKPGSKEQGADHVLSRFSKRDRAEIDVTIADAADAVEAIARDGIDAAMNRYNGTAGA